MENTLTSMQLAFANHVLDGMRNNAEAYRLAYHKPGCSISQASVEAYRLRHHPLVAAFIRQEQKALRDYGEGKITSDRYLAIASRRSVGLWRTPIQKRHFFPTSGDLPPLIG